MLKPESPRRHSVFGFENFVKIAEIVVSYIQADIGNGKIGIQEQIDSLLEPFFLQEFRVGLSGDMLDRAAELIQVTRKIFCKIG